MKKCISYMNRENYLKSVINDDLNNTISINEEMKYLNSRLKEVNKNSLVYEVLKSKLEDIEMLYNGISLEKIIVEECNQNLGKEM